MFEGQKLLPDRHPTRDFFVPDIFDNLPFKDDMASMSYPMFSLSKKKDMRNLEYHHGEFNIKIKPTTDGLPTIFDKDVLLYCGSQLMAEVNAGRVPPRKLRISSRDLLVATNRHTNDVGYKLLKKALDRLSGVKIKTNIKTNKREITTVFGLIESYEVIESSRVKDRMIRLEITLSEWFYNSIVGKEVLTINRDYFRLRKPLERRLYEIARKHCGRQGEWSIRLDNLKDRVGSTSSMPKFRFFINQQSNEDHLPDYTLLLSGKDIVTFRRKRNTLRDLEDIPYIKPETIDKGRKIVCEAGTGWDYQELRGQFTAQLMEGFTPEKVDGAFINFVKKKVQKSP